MNNVRSTNIRKLNFYLFVKIIILDPLTYSTIPLLEQVKAWPETLIAFGYSPVPTKGL